MMNVNYDFDYYGDNPYWAGQIYPDCCPYYCTYECFPVTQPPPPPTAPPKTTTTMPSGTCGFEIPGWNMILNRHIYLGELENELSWHAADAKSIEVGGHLFGPVDNDIFEAIKECYDEGTRIWIGGQNIANANFGWRWSNGSRIQDESQFDPNTNFGACLDVILPDDLSWKKSPCNGRNTSHAFVAQKGHQPTTPPPTR